MLFAGIRGNIRFRLLSIFITNCFPIRLAPLEPINSRSLLGLGLYHQQVKERLLTIPLHYPIHHDCYVVGIVMTIYRLGNYNILM